MTSAGRNRALLIPIAAVAVIVLVVVVGRLGHERGRPPAGGLHTRSAPAIPARASAEEGVAPVLAAAPDEDPAPPSPARGGADLTLTVLDPAGAPLPAALLVVHAGDVLLGHAVTDRDGKATLREDARRGQIAVLPRGDLPLLYAPFDADSATTIQLDRGDEVTGRVLLDGGVPRERLRLRLAGEDPTLSDLPSAVLNELGLGEDAASFLRAVSAVSRTTWTEADGSFRFRGLSPRWAGTLSWGPALVREGARAPDTDVLRLDRPRTGVDLRLARIVRVSAYLCDESGAAVCRRRVRLEGVGVSEGGATDDRGLVSMELHAPLPDEIRLVVHRPGVRDHEVTLATPAVKGSTWDLGSIVVPGPLELSVRVLDESGRPVPAQVCAEDPHGATQSTSFTDVEGRISIALTSSLKAVRIEAARHLPVRKKAPFPESGELVVVLREAASATVLPYVEPSGTAGHLLVSLLPADGSGVDASGEDWSRTLLAKRVAKDAIEFPRIAAGVPLTLTVHDPVGRALHRQEVGPIPAGGHRDIPVRVTWEPVSFYLRIHGPDGTGLHRVQVLVDGREVDRTDAVGDVGFEHVAAGRMDLELRCDGFEDLILPGFSVPRDGEWITLRMSAP